MKQITVTLHEGVPPADVLLLARFDRPVLDYGDCSGPYINGSQWIEDASKVTAYILMDDLQAAVEAALKEEE